MLKNFLTLALIALALMMSGCGSLGEKRDETKGWSADKLYAEAKDELRSGNYEKAIKYFEKLESRYPFGVYAQQAQMEVAYAYYRQNEQAQCLAAVERFIRLHPNHPSVDYMYYLRGLANFNDKKGLFDFISSQDPTERDPKATRAAFDAFKQLVERFPVIIQLGAAVLAFTAAKMVMGEPLLDPVFDAPGNAWLQWPVYAVAVAGVLGLGAWSAKRTATAQG